MQVNIPPAFDDPTRTPRTWNVPDTIVRADELARAKIRELLDTNAGEWIAVSADGTMAIESGQDQAELALLGKGIATTQFVVRRICEAEAAQETDVQVSPETDAPRVD